MKDTVGVVIGATLVTLGLVWWIGGIDAMASWWPALVVAVGGGFLVAGRSGETGSVGLTIAGTVITATGLLLWMQTISGLWATWAYAWALIGPFAVGAAITWHARRRDPGTKSGVGPLLMWIGAAAFGVGFVFFEGVLAINGLDVPDVVWPLGLILIGVVLLVVRRPGPSR